MDAFPTRLLSALTAAGLLALGGCPQPADAGLDPNAPGVAGDTATGDSAPMAQAPSTAPAAPGTEATAPAASDGGDAPRLPIRSGRVEGSVSLLGGRIDDLRLRDYRVTNDPGADIVTVLSPVGTPSAYYALYGWAPGSGLSLEDVPGANTLWQVERTAVPPRDRHR